MAELNFGTNHPLAVKLWSRKLFYDTLKSTWASKFMGTDSNSLCQILEDTQKSEGDKITYGLRMQLSGDGISGDGTLEGNEERLTFYDDNLIIDQLRHAVRQKGKMSEQRVPYNLREEARSALKDWWADRMDTWFMNQLAGNTAVTDVRYTGMQATVAPDANHVLIGGLETAEGSLSATTTHSLKLRDIDRAVAKAKTSTIQIRPIKINDGDYYALFLHPFQVYQLRTDTSTLQWGDIQKAAMMGGQITKNPLFTGALGMYNGVVLHESTRVPLVPSQTVYRRAIFAGAQAAALAFGKNSGPNKMSWVEEKFDYGDALGVSAGMIAGLKKSRFNSADFGVITISTYAPSV